MAHVHPLKRESTFKKLLKKLKEHLPEGDLRLLEILKGICFVVVLFICGSALKTIQGIPDSKTVEIPLRLLLQLMILFTLLLAVKYI